MSLSLAERVVRQALAAGATLAGLTSASAVAEAPSCAGRAALTWPSDARAVLVLALSHPADEPELDWWGGKGGTPGNRVLIRICNDLKRWLGDELGVAARVLPYHVERGGIFLKDAAVLAGLGVIGANNLLITPTLGPRVRFKALVLDLEPPPAAEPAPDPVAAAIARASRRARSGLSPQGRYALERCSVQMKRDESDPQTAPAGDRRDLPPRFTIYCRACELACPVGR